MLQEEDVNVDAFVDAVASTEKKEAQNNQSQKGFEFPVCVGIGNKAIVRFVNGIAETALDQGKPGSGRAKLFNIGWVKDDAGKSFPLCLPAIINNKPMYHHTLIDFIDKVLSRTWVDNPNPAPGAPKGEWKYFYAERNDYGQLASGEMTLKDIFWNVFKSGANPSSQYYKTQKSWRGQTVYVANVIDRLDYAWHQKNKKTKLLMRSTSVKDGQLRHKEASFFAMGAPLKEITDNHGVKLNYDVLIVPGTQPTDKFALKNVSKFKEKDYWDDVKSIITEEDKKLISMSPTFTDEEKTWEPIDIDKYYRFTSSAAILKHFGKTIKNFDAMVGTNFYETFQNEAKLEEAARKAAKGDKAETTDSTPVAESTSVAPQETVSQTTPNVASTTVAQSTAPVNSSPVSQPVQSAPVQSPSFDTMSPAGVPADVTPSAAAQADIESFYDDLEN